MTASSNLEERKRNWQASGRANERVSQEKKERGRSSAEWIEGHNTSNWTGYVHQSSIYIQSKLD